MFHTIVQSQHKTGLLVSIQIHVLSSCICELQKNQQALKRLLANCYFVLYYEEKEEDEEEVIKQMNNYYVAAIESGSFSNEQCRLINQSHEAFVLDGATSAWKCSQAAVLNGEIVTDSDTEDCEQYVGLKSLQSEQAKAIIMRRRQQIGRRARYVKAKMLAERKFLACKQSTSVRGILKDFPNIGKKIEEFVQEKNVGADVPVY